MNEHFVPIKVDREERPDVDSIYMQAVQAMTGHGGWPLTVFLDPDGVPFYGGTYFPPEAAPRDAELPPGAGGRRRRPGARGARRSHPPAAAHGARRSMRRRGCSPRSEILSPAVLDEAERALAPQFDPVNGGFGGAPKFPPASALEFLMRGWRPGERARRKRKEMVERTLDRMAKGGMYDQVGGGFARYSVDAHWLVPHFEKMLYDNALLARAYLHGWQLTGDDRFRARLHRDARLGAARDARARGRLLLGARRRLRGRGRQVLRLDVGRGARRCSATRPSR